MGMIPMLSLQKTVKIEKMELIKVKCYECGIEYPVPVDMPTCHCRGRRSNFVENVALGKPLSVDLDYTRLDQNC